MSHHETNCTKWFTNLRLSLDWLCNTSINLHAGKCRDEVDIEGKGGQCIQKPHWSQILGSRRQLECSRFWDFSKIAIEISVLWPTARDNVWGRAERKGFSLPFLANRMVNVFPSYNDWPSWKAHSFMYKSVLSFGRSSSSSGGVWSSLCFTNTFDVDPLNWDSPSSQHLIFWVIILEFNRMEIIENEPQDCRQAA